MSKGRFSLAYWGPIDYYSKLIKQEKVCFEQCESFPKQSYRNRCYIDSPNGKLMLNFPVDHSSKDYIKDTRIKRNENWQQKHWQAFKSSYGGSPFFDALAPEIEAFYKKEWIYLLDLNIECHKLISKWLVLKIDFDLSKDWQLELDDEIDFRDAFHPKIPSPVESQNYPQVFSHKHGFIQNLSVLDLLFNEGPAAYDHLQLL